MRNWCSGLIGRRGLPSTGANLAFISINAALLGIIGDASARIYVQIKRDPLTVIEDVVNASAGKPVLPSKPAA